jgi:hypothetical protein
MVKYHQGNRERIVNDLTNLYVFKGLTLKDYAKATPEEQKSILAVFRKDNRLKLNRELVDQEDARSALHDHFSAMSERQIRAIYNNVLGPKPKSRRLKEKARQRTDGPKEPYCKAEHPGLFDELFEK